MGQNVPNSDIDSGIQNTMSQQPLAAKRDGFTSSFGVLAATLGSAVGLGNIWKFPSLTGMNGGAGFLLATLLVGLPVMIVETMLGRAARANTITTFERVAPRDQWWWKIIGWMGAKRGIQFDVSEDLVGGCAYDAHGTPLTDATIMPWPISRAVMQPISVKATRPTASSAKNSERKWRISGAIKIVTKAATEVSTRYSGCLTQVSG